MIAENLIYEVETDEVKTISLEEYILASEIILNYKSTMKLHF